MDVQSETGSKYERLLAEKADRLADLFTRKPGQKQYKASLKAFLEADAKAQKALFKWVELRAEPRSFEP
jgi:hypothetical protein